MRKKSPKGFCRIVTVGSRSLSHWPRNGWQKAINASVTPAPAANAHCHPNINARDGAASPAATPPSGTPVCLMEKIILRFSGFDTSTSRCEAEGLVKPYQRFQGTGRVDLRADAGVEVVWKLNRSVHVTAGYLHEWLDSTDEPFVRLENRYNLTAGNSRVADGDATDFAGSLGFLPQRFEFYNTLESADGGDGSTAGAATDNPDEATMISIAPGDLVPGVDIAINLDPDTGKTTSQRENPTGISRHDVINPAANLFGGIGLNEEGNNDNYWLMRVPASDLPPTPYNVTGKTKTRKPARAKVPA